MLAIARAAGRFWASLRTPFVPLEALEALEDELHDPVCEAVLRRRLFPYPRFERPAVEAQFGAAHFQDARWLWMLLSIIYVVIVTTSLILRPMYVTLPAGAYTLPGIVLVAVLLLLFPASYKIAVGGGGSAFPAREGAVKAVRVELWLTAVLCLGIFTAGCALFLPAVLQQCFRDEGTGPTTSCTRRQSYFQYWLGFVIVPALPRWWLAPTPYLAGVVACLAVYPAWRSPDSWSPAPGATARYDFRSYFAVDLFILASFYVGTLAFSVAREDLHRKGFAVVLLLARQQRASARESERISDLLHHMLPKTALARLLRSEPVHDWRHASVLVADICGFTRWCSSRSAAAVVDMLGAAFSAFDEIAMNLDVVKIKTAGDGYTATCGLSEAVDRHAQATVQFALLIHAKLGELCATESTWGTLKMRVGVHSGLVVGAVLSRQRWAYDIFGHVPHAAKQLEAACPEGATLVSARTRSLLPPSDDPSWAATGSGSLELDWTTVIMSDGPDLQLWSGERLRSYVVELRGFGAFRRLSAALSSQPSNRSLHKRSAFDLDAAQIAAQLLTAEGLRRQRTLSDLPPLQAGGVAETQSVEDSHSSAVAPQHDRVPVADVESWTLSDSRTLSMRSASSARSPMRTHASSQDPQRLLSFTTVMPSEVAPSGSGASSGPRRRDRELQLHLSGNGEADGALFELSSAYLLFVYFSSEVISSGLLGGLEWRSAAERGLMLWQLLGFFQAFLLVRFGHRLHAAGRYAFPAAMLAVLSQTLGVFTAVLQIKLRPAVFVFQSGPTAALCCVATLLSLPLWLSSLLQIAVVAIWGLAAFLTDSTNEFGGTTGTLTSLVLVALCVYASSNAFRGALSHVSADQQQLLLAAEKAHQSTSALARLLALKMPPHVREVLLSGAAGPFTCAVDTAVVCFCRFESRVGQRRGTAHQFLQDTLAAHEVATDVVDALLPTDQRDTARYPLLDKVKTMGDTVLVAGCLDPRIQPPGAVLCEQVLSFLIRCRELLTAVCGGRDLRISLQAGVSFGPVTAAVIGTQQLEYDVFGTTVNLASRILTAILSDAACEPQHLPNVPADQPVPTEWMADVETEADFSECHATSTTSDIRCSAEVRELLVGGGISYLSLSGGSDPPGVEVSSSPLAQPLSFGDPIRTSAKGLGTIEVFPLQLTDWMSPTLPPRR